jgi:hypothetical protein
MRSKEGREEAASLLLLFAFSASFAVQILRFPTVVVSVILLSL